jgi:uncharacterized integral membrane protein
VLLATGLIVGDIFGVVFAMLVGATQQDTPLALVAENAWAVPLSIVIFAVAILGLYAWTRNQAGTAPTLPEAHITPPHEIAPR